MRIHAWALVGLLVATTGPLWARPIDDAEIPQALRDWKSWVLYDETQGPCPYRYNGQGRQCLWPGVLELELDDGDGRFRQDWEVLSEAWLALPGGPKHWPAQVTVDGQAAPVTDRAGRPRVRVAPGAHHVQGRFLWRVLPQSLHIPPETGLLALRVSGTPVHEPVIDEDGRLWIQGRRRAAQGLAERLDLKVYRRITDAIPMQVETRLQLDVAGAQREVALDQVLPQGFVALALNSVLPARLETGGRLRLQLRPGSWTVTVTARSTAPVDALPVTEHPSPWPSQEIWVFDARPQLRVVGVSGGESVDPLQTTLPAQWRGLPAYRMRPGDRLSFALRRRGYPQPEPNRLALERSLWLDFDGQGLSARDRISGAMTQGWRLEARPDLDLGRVEIGGRAQLITRLPGRESEGVEVRHGLLDIQTQGRYEGDSTELDITGWDQDFRQVRTTLNLPPGWRLFHVSGVDNRPQTWVQRWTLLDLFLVLIAAIAAGRLFGWRWAPVVLLGLAALWHEPGAPRLVWLNVLAAVALLRVVPAAGRFQRAVTWYRNLSLLALVALAIPFMVQELRVALYPQLERPWQAAVDQGRAAVVQEEALSTPSSAPSFAKRAGAPPQMPRSLDQIDPNAARQTGPGLPQWTWTQIPLQWNGPVERGQQISLTFLSPAANTALNLARVALLLLLGWRLAVPGRRSRVLASAWLAPALLLPLMAAVPDPAWAGLPSPELLEQLGSRLSAAPQCLPSCADIARMTLRVDPGMLRIRAQVHAQDAVAVPIPGDPEQWQPQQVLIDGKVAPGLWRDPQGVLWVPVEAGIHSLDLAGALPGRDSLQIVFPLRPHRAEIESQGWVVEGLAENGVVGPQLQLIRLREGDGAKGPLRPLALPPFLRVERDLHLGLDWTATTRVLRLSPPGEPVVLRIPVLQGESVITDGLDTEDGAVLVSLGPDQTAFQWRSVLEKTPHIRLKAPETDAWVELWRLDASPVWHVTLGGIPVIHHQGQGAVWLPTWRPWPGEHVDVTVTRPEGVAGQTLTIERASLTVVPGRRSTDATLALTLRSSLGTRHRLRLPAHARLQSLSLNGTPQPIRQVGETITVPLSPGTSELRLDWRAAQGISQRLQTPAPDLGAPAVNAQIVAQMGQDRWILFTGGPRLGPAVLFWGVVIAVALLALGLGRFPHTPLKAWQWFLLGIGLSQGNIITALIVVGWLIALGTRQRWLRTDSAAAFDLAQILLVLWTLLALAALFDAVQQGLLGYPEMQIQGNASTATQLNWYQDRIGPIYPQAWVVSVPLWVYRGAMLAWALWLAFALLDWLKWGWQRYSEGGLWRPLARRKAKQPVREKQAVPTTQGLASESPPQSD